MSSHKDRSCLLVPLTSSIMLLEKQLNALSAELNCFGLPSINVKVDVLEQLASSISRLIQMHRKSLHQQKDSGLKINSLKNQLAMEEKKVKTFSDELHLMQSESKYHQETIRHLKADVESLKESNAAANKQIDCLQSLHNSKEMEYNHKMTRLRLDNNELREKLGEEIGSYKSQDMIIVNLLNKYKAKEVIYEDTIQKLQDNNMQLLNQVMNLKEEIILAIYKNNTN